MTGKRELPGRRQVMFRSLMNVRPSHLADPTLFDFAGLAAAMAEAENSMQLSDEH
jgi:tRNA 2-thiocytidine biosynthesis protein TtcA